MLIILVLLLDLDAFKVIQNIDDVTKGWPKFQPFFFVDVCLEAMRLLVTLTYLINTLVYDKFCGEPVFVFMTNGKISFLG